MLELVLRMGKAAPNLMIALIKRVTANNKMKVNGLFVSMALLFIIIFLIRLQTLQTRWFDSDEFEHVHAAWCVSKGQLPYTDFFEHHTPWLYYLMAPLFNFFAVETDASAIQRFLVVGRWLSLFAAVVITALVYWIGRIWSNLFVGMCAAIFLFAMPMFIDKTTEIRPDVPAVALWLACLTMLLRGLRTDLEQGRKDWKSFLGCGLCLGGAIMFTQKALFVLPGISIGMLLWVIFALPRRHFEARFGLASLTALGICTPGVLTWGYFALHGGGTKFVFNNFLLNAHWKLRKPPDEALHEIVTSSWPLLVLVFGGILMVWRDILNRSPQRWPGIILFTSLLGVFAGAYVIPVAERQYFLMLLPLLALFAAMPMDWLANQSPIKWGTTLTFIILILLHIMPIAHVVRTMRSSNRQQLGALAYVLGHSSPTDTVLDGWRGMGTFRPHAFYYYFLHPEIRAMLPPVELDVFLDDLENGRARPKLVILDANLSALSPRLVNVLETNYTFDSKYEIYIRRDLNPVKVFTEDFR